MMEVDYEPVKLLGSLNETESKHVPKRLYAAGDVELLRRSPRVAVIGSRNASAQGIQKTGTVARVVVERGGVVVSGLALGVDAAAHRGAIAADAKTGDGAGILTQIPWEFFQRELSTTGHTDVVRERFAVGMIFFPQDESLRVRCRAIINDMCQQQGLAVLQWRTVPVDPSMRTVAPVLATTFAFSKMFFISGPLPIMS